MLKWPHAFQRCGGNLEDLDGKSIVPVATGYCANEQDYQTQSLLQHARYWVKPLLRYIKKNTGEEVERGAPAD